MEHKISFNFHFINPFFKGLSRHLVAMMIDTGHLQIVEPYRKKNYLKKHFLFCNNARTCSPSLKLSQVETHKPQSSWAAEIGSGGTAGWAGRACFFLIAALESTPTNEDWLINQQKMAKLFFNQVVFEMDFVLDVLILSTKQE